MELSKQCQQKKKGPKSNSKIDMEEQMRYPGVEISNNMKASTHITKRRESVIKTTFALSNVGFNKKELSSETRA